MFNTYQNFISQYADNDQKITESIDILNDYKSFTCITLDGVTKTIENRGLSKQSIVTSDRSYSYFPISDTDLDGYNVRYNSTTKIFTITIPLRCYEYEKVAIKAIKTNISHYTEAFNVYVSFMTYCSLSSNISHRVGFNSSNLNEGIDYMPLNGVTEFDIWFEANLVKEKYDISSLSLLYDNIVIEFEYINRK